MRAHWLARYAREQSIHLLVIGLLAAYPGVHYLAVNSKLASQLGIAMEMQMLLPRVATMITVLYFGLFAMSFDFVSGYTGYLSFGHAAFYGAGAYFVVLVANGKVPLLGAGTPFMVSLVLAGVVAALLAVVIGALSFRLSGVYFAMITLGFAQLAYVFIRDWDWLGSNPRQGISVSFASHPDGFQVGVPWVDQLNLAIGQLAGESVVLLGHELDAVGVSYYMVGLVVLVCYFAMQRMIHSPFGRVMIAIRENEERARAVGYDTFWYKLGAFAASAFYAGIAGALYAGYVRSVTPKNSFYFQVSGDALLASVLGGFGTLAGPLFGRLFDQTLTEFLSKAGLGGGLLPYLEANLGTGTMETALVGGMTVRELIVTFLNGHAGLYIGLLFVVFVLYVPGGLLGSVRNRLGGTVAEVAPKRVEHYLKGLRK